MESFLAGCRAALQDHTQSGRAVHVVMGNEACDLDSTVSALVLAYFLAKTSPDSSTAFVPVLNIPRADFPLRTESTFLLLQQHIPEKVLVFRDEIDLAGLHKAGLLTLTLVDHHILPSKDSALEAAVVEVMDHRPLEWERPPPCRVTVELVGSCTTLVTERLLQARVPVLDGQIAALLYGTILLDCVNMAVEAGKATPRDARCVSRLESMFSELQPRNRVFDALQRAKFDVSGFGLLIAMAIFFGDHKKPFRQLAVYSPQAVFQEAACQALESSSNPSLGLSRLETPCPTIRAYQQGNTGASRKKLLPIVREFLHQWGRSTPTSPGMQPEISSHVPPARVDLQGAGSRDPSGAKDAPKAPRLGEEPAEEDTLMPPTPMNSLVDECPLHQGLPGVSPEAIFERVNRIATDRSLDGHSPEKKK
ncbi:putative Protein prune-like protein [Naja naja]|nr:putative Protein prune-like protein [Naja naja]